MSMFYDRIPFGVYKKTIASSIERWYKNAAIDYDVTGGLISITEDSDTIEIRHHEDGVKFQFRMKWYKDYSPEQVFDIWSTAEWQEM